MLRAMRGCIGCMFWVWTAVMVAATFWPFAIVLADDQGPHQREAQFVPALILSGWTAAAVTVWVWLVGAVFLFLAHHLAPKRKLLD